MRHKKSQIEVANVLIIALVIAIVLIAAVTSFLSSLGSKGDIETCRLSILVASKVAESAKIADLIKNFNTKLRCVAPFTRIGSDEKSQKLAERQVMSRVAEEMRSCWYKMGAHDLSFLDSRWQEPMICIVCSEFTLDRNIDTSKMMEFLRDSNIPNTKEKYIDYFDSDWKEDIGRDTKELIPDMFFVTKPDSRLSSLQTLLKTTKQDIKQEKENTYAVLYIRSGWSAWGKLYYTGVSSSTAHEYDFQSLFVIPKQDIAKTGLCEHLFYQKQDTGWLFK